jgi:hypothetical protein
MNGDPEKISELVSQLVKSFAPTQQKWVAKNSDSNDFDVVCAMWCFARILQTSFDAPKYCVDDGDREVLRKLADSMTLVTGGMDDIPPPTQVRA